MPYEKDDISMEALDYRLNQAGKRAKKTGIVAALVFGGFALGMLRGNCHGTEAAKPESVDVKVLRAADGSETCKYQVTAADGTVYKLNFSDCPSYNKQIPENLPLYRD